MKYCDQINEIPEKYQPGNNIQIQLSNCHAMPKTCVPKKKIFITLLIFGIILSQFIILYKNKKKKSTKTNKEIKIE